ncbi:Cysteine-rich receptor-like protein kinase 10 [Dichanthelium oligosanthes]|uniref:Cysteine-rich receptor-like protein kinase 10 n=1 Tax=Dichanthelium oligosanthes TaxID=888268 RepID=A0A1E5VIU9_9POAL|nr:Cysteine-rich receptor-like protein kinase 10 [Dichanthelium oligosanthes]
MVKSGVSSAELSHRNPQVPTSHSHIPRTMAMLQAHCPLRLAITAAAALLVPLAAAYPWQVCGTTGNFTANSTYQANLALLAGALPRNTSSAPDLFATAVVGAIPDQISALALCRGDANATACSACLDTAFQDVQNMCAYDRSAAIYYDPCILYYSDVHFLSSADNVQDAMTNRVNLRNVTSDPARFNRLVAALVNATADYAAHNSTRRYAAGEADFDQEYPKVYSWAQCTPDLTPAQCRACLAGIIAFMPRLFTNRVGGRVLGVRCSYRYEVYSFLDSPVMVQLAESGSSSGAPAPATEPAAVTPAATGGDPGRATEEENIEIIESMIIDISTLRAATGDFAESNKLGEGGFGAVYKGTLPDGHEIAVKRLSRCSTQGVGELKNELALVAKLQHKNLVSLVGVCLEQQERLLVYEFVPNRSLDQILFGTTICPRPALSLQNLTPKLDDPLLLLPMADSERREQLDWAKRCNIIHGIARGLQYLHEDSQLRVVHRDLKASNILLDMNMNPKISDFGMARLFGRDQTHGVTNHVVGTYGYMAPEYLTRGNYSVKSDVFSFGVMVLEIVTGKKHNGGCHGDGRRSPEDVLSLVSAVCLLSVVQSISLADTYMDMVQVWEHWTAGAPAAVAEAIIDPRMGSCFSRSDVLRCIHIGLLCVQEDPADRPVMSSVVMMLGSDTVSLLNPSSPAFYGRNRASPTSSTSSGEYTA